MFTQLNPRLTALAVVLTALSALQADAQELGVGSRVFGPPPTRTIVGGTFTVGHGGVYGHGLGWGGYGYRPYYTAYGWGGPHGDRPPHFRYGCFRAWGELRVPGFWS